MAVSGRVWALLALTFAVVHSEDTEIRYDGYRLLQVHPESHEDISVLRKLMHDTQLDFWREPSIPGRPVDILASPDKVPFVQSYLSSMPTELIINDVQSLIDENVQVESLGTDAEDFDFNNYHTIESIYAWMNRKATENNNTATIITAGVSTEGRNLTGLRIAYAPNLPVVIIEAGIHPREWIAPPTALWFVDQLLSNNATDIMKAYEWHVFPSINPDGYAITQKARLWNKTRRQVVLGCLGVDVNRNFPFKWETDNFPCLDNYPGNETASEPEVKGWMNYIDNMANRTRVYISLQSYGQLLMYPYGYVSIPLPNWKRWDEVAVKAVAAIKTPFNTTYKYGSMAGAMYPIYGNSLDYAYIRNIPYPFAFSLRDEYHFKYLLPPDQIVPTAQETLEGLKVILEEAKN